MSSSTDITTQQTGKGTKEQPFLITPSEYDEIKDILHEGEIQMGAVSKEQQAGIRALYRGVLLEKFPYLFDHAHLKVL